MVMKQALLVQEYVLVSRRYTDEKCIRPEKSQYHHILHSRLPSRHETDNEHIQTFNNGHNIFRHNLNKHRGCFHAVSQISAKRIDAVNPFLPLKLKSY